MPVDDRWYLAQRDPATKKRIPSQRYGRGKRWRVRYTDAAGHDRERLFDLKVDAEDFDARCRTGVAAEVKPDHEQRRVTFAEYAERWRQARETYWTAETRRRIPRNISKHLVPVFGSKAYRSITLTDVLAWLSSRVEAGTPKSSLSLYLSLFKTISNAAVVDRVIPDNPCAGVNLAQVLRGLTRTPKWVPTQDQVLALAEVVPDRYRAAIWLGAVEAMRLGEVLGMENGTRCADFLRRELHVVQQLVYSPREAGGFFLASPKSGSAGTIELDPLAADHLAEHIHRFPPVAVDLPDITSGEPVRRQVPILFTTQRGKLICQQRWAEMWAGWRDEAGWPVEGTFHSLRHFCATTLLSHGVEPQEVQKTLRHANLRITLETYAHWLPKTDRPRGVMSRVMTNTDRRRQTGEQASEDQI